MPAPAVLGPTTRPPARRPGSVRRTATILMTWPDGVFDGVKLNGRCRDLLTIEGHDPVVLAQEGVVAVVSLDRTIRMVATSPPTVGIRALEGARAGGRLRAALEEVAGDVRERGRGRYLLLDDLVGTSLIAGFALFRWRDHLPELAGLRGRLPVQSMQGVCSGFRPGASSLLPDGTMSSVPQQVASVPPLVDPDDPIGWHEHEPLPAMAMRRARRIDVWRAGDGLQVDAMFRDSCWEPDGTEIAVHEYRLTATADLAAGTLTEVVAEPRVLPYDECPAAAANVGLVRGVPLADLRREVLARIQGTDCCTHLNDALRSLAEVPVLAAAIPPTAGR